MGYILAILAIVKWVKFISRRQIRISKFYFPFVIAMGLVCVQLQGYSLTLKADGALADRANIKNTTDTVLICTKYRISSRETGHYYKRGNTFYNIPGP